MLALHEIDGLEADEALQAVVTRVARRMGTEVATLYAYDPDRERLVLAATHGLARSAIGFVTLALGEGISGEAALRRSPVAAADVGRDPQFKIIPGFDQSRYRSILAVPVSHRGELLGVLNVQTVAPREYGPADRDLLCRLADEVARHLARTGRDGHLALRLRGPTLLSTLSGMVAASGGRTEVCVRVLAELAVVLPEADTAIALSPGRHDAEPVLIAPDGGSDAHPDLAAALHGGPPAAEDAVLVLPLGRDGDRHGLLALRSAKGAGSWRDPAVRHYLESVAEQLGLALERLPDPAAAPAAAPEPERSTGEPGLYDRLVAVVLDDRGLEALVAEASAACGTWFGVVDCFGTPLAGTVDGEVSAELPLHPAESPPGRLLVGPAPPPEDDLAVIAHVVALELAKWKAAFEVESRLRGDVLDLLLSDDADPREALPRASLVGLNLARPYRPVWFGYAGEGEDGALAARSRAEIVRRALGEPPQVVLFQRPHGILALVDEAVGDVEARARAAARHLAAVLRGRAVGVGCGTPVVWPDGFRAAVRRAELASDLGRRLGHPGPVDVGRLGVYGLLLELDETAWRAFVTEQLGPLLDHDAATGGELVRTLEAYHCLRGGLRAVADALFVHVNTLKYRLARIDALTGGRFSSPSGRFQMYLALYALRLLEPERPSLLADEAVAGLPPATHGPDGPGAR